MSSEKQTDLGLHKWGPTDGVLRKEFNDNFGKIDEKVAEVVGLVESAAGAVADIGDLSLIPQATVVDALKDKDDKITTVNTQLADVVIDVKKFGAHDRSEPGYGNFDSSDAIQAAHDSSLKGCVYLSGNFNVSKTINYKKPMRGSDKTKSGLYSNITDGSEVILIDDKDYWELTDFVIRGQDKNCFGIRAKNDSSWYNLYNVDVRDCALGGYDLEGWGGVIDDCHAISNSIYGWTLRRANGVKANLHADANDGVGVIIESGGGLHLLSLLSEGNTQGGLEIKGGYNITLTSPYFEANKKFQIKGGHSGVEIRGISILGGSSTSVFKDNEGGFLFDLVNGLNVDGTFIHCESNNPLETTANTSNVKLNTNRTPYGFIHDSGNSFNKKFNYMPNSNFDSWLSGYSSISYTPSVLSVSSEPLVKRTGLRSLKVQSAVNRYGFMSLGLNAKTIEYLKNKRVTFGAWIYVPDIEEFQNPAIRPLIQLSANSSGRSTFNQTYLKLGSWNFVTLPSPLLISHLDTVVAIEIYPHIKTDLSATGNEYVLVDSIYVGEYGSVSYSDLVHGNLVDHQSLPKVENDNIIMRGSAKPTNNAAWNKYIFKTGDKIINTLPVAGGYEGWVCISDGAIGNVGTWKGFGIIEA